MRKAFRFWEIIVLIEASETDAYRPLLDTIDHLRICTLRRGTGHYKRRVIASQEAIGDIVFLAEISDLKLLDYVDMIKQAHTNGMVVIPMLSTSSLLRRSAWSPITALGWASGYHVGINYMASFAIPRTIVNQLLRRPDAELALRFPPRDFNAHYSFLPVSNSLTRRFRRNKLARQLYLSQILLINIAPRLLLWVSLSSCMLVFLGLAYAVYVVIIWLTLSEVEPGWVTLSSVLSAFAIFMGSAIFGLSLGLQFLLHRLQKLGGDDVLDELNAADIYKKVKRDLNVEVEADMIPSQISPGSYDEKA
ncbi:MAG: hypothetical protein HKO02_04520 [Hyphomonadaceae bacterium]|nr:hypothetical protein [Hyphomonadaceae bacterium]